MARKQSNKALLEAIREVVASVTNDFPVRCYGREMKDVGIPKGGFQRLNEVDGYFIIQDLLEGKQSSLTRDYLRTKRDAVKASRPISKPAL